MPAIQRSRSEPAGAGDPSLFGYSRNRLTHWAPENWSLIQRVKKFVLDPACAFYPSVSVLMLESVLCVLVIQNVKCLLALI